MFEAIRFTGNHFFAAELKIWRARLARGPTAHAGSQVFQLDHFDFLLGFADRRLTLGKAEPMRLADDGVLRDTEPAPDFTRRQILVPQIFKFIDAFGSPINGHIFYRSRRSTTR